MILNSTRESVRRLSECLVACNIYISAGQSRWAPFLLDLLQDAQHECTNLRKLSPSSRLAVVHTFADGPYDRSSFHVAGSSVLVASLASYIATKAATSLLKIGRGETNPGFDPVESSTAHPTVGLVDHVAVLPLLEDPQDDFSSVARYSFEQWEEVYHRGDCGTSVDSKQDARINRSESLPAMAVPTGWVARSVGKAMDKVGVQVFWYGHADPDQTPLSEVRRHKTKFFQSLPSSSFPSPLRMGQATVGAPSNFVENYNIQVATNDKNLAQSLTKFVRSRDGGLPFVEALTLPYGYFDNDTEPRDKPIPLYEIACNLLNPVVTSTHQIDERVKEWSDLMNGDNKVKILRSYRVGTTTAMCLNVLEEVASVDGERRHNQKVREALEEFLK